MTISEEKIRSYLIYVTVIEGRHFAIANMDSVVHIRVDKKRKSTGLERSTDCPFFDEYFVFEFNCKLQELLDKHIVITVIQPRKMCRFRKVLGHFNLDVSTLWTAHEHQFYHKWAILNSSENVIKPGPKGYLKIDIGILTKGEIPHIPLISDDDDEIEGNLLLPEDVPYDRPRANYTINIFYAEDLPKLKEPSVKKIVESEHMPNSYVEITFAGITGKTSVRKHSLNPIWNEKIIFTELFPSLCQRIKIQLKFTQNMQPASQFIYLNSISNDEQNGFLPTFGPSYIFLYGTDAQFEVVYKGKLFIEITTEILTDLMWSTNNIDVLPIKVLPKLDLWRKEFVLLFCSIYSVNMIENRYKDKNISFEITMGGTDSESGTVQNSSFSMTSVMDNKKLYSFLPLNERAYCLSTISQWPDARKRIFNSNMVKKIYETLQKDLKELELFYEPQHYKNSREKIDVLLNILFENLAENCKNYLEVARNVIPDKIKLDELQLNLCISEFQAIQKNIEQTYFLTNRKKKFRKYHAVLERIFDLVDEVQTCWPDVFLCMKVGNKKVGLIRIPSKDIIYSKNAEQRGKFCGTFQEFYMKPTKISKIKLNFGENSSLQCKLTLQMWVGLLSEKNSCLEMIPECYKVLEMDENNEIPRQISTSSKYNFSCKVYVYQGRFIPGADNTGLSDPYAQVIMGNFSMNTRAIKKSLDPIWNQTLIVNSLILHGSLDYIQDNPLVIDVELYDQDILSKSDFLGRCTVIPEIIIEDNVSSKTTCKLKKIKVMNEQHEVGDILISAELIMTSIIEDDIKKFNFIEYDFLPDEIMPEIYRFRLDVYFWGVHSLKKIQMKKVLKPRMIVYCGGHKLMSHIAPHVKKYVNFPKPYNYMDINIPDNEEFYPPLIIKLFDCRGFGVNVYIGIHLANLQDFIYKPIIKFERDSLLKKGRLFSIDSNISEVSQKSEETVPTKVQQTRRFSKILGFLPTFNLLKQTDSKEEQNEDHQLSELVDNADWWTKFYLSLEGETNTGAGQPNNMNLLAEKLKLKIYNGELEDQPEYNSFEDLIQTFKMSRGKRTGDEVIDDANTIAIFKGAIRIYRWPPASYHDADEYVTEHGFPLTKGSFQNFPANEAVAFLVRVYVIRGINLRPKDQSGKSDPYVIIKMSDQVINDRKNYFPNKVNPVFGRCFELRGVFPEHNILKIEVMDYDVTTSDDLIGATSIDLEKRMYTNHRGHCGIAKEYIQVGPCAWRDQYKPSQILEILCRRNRIEIPIYFENAIQVGPCHFGNDKPINEDNLIQKEVLGLLALHRWDEIPLVGCPLVPEHVETRSLYHYSKPGLEQGKLQIWIDIFPCGDFPAPPPVIVTPRKPIAYELRIIVWNTDSVILDEDDFFLGEKKSDIYVKGWMTGPDSSQCTDVHYNSLSGEGNFNWRFLFPFYYLFVEDKIVINKKKSVFAKDMTEQKIPCKLMLQVWDNDTFSKDDFLGALSLSLTKLPRGAKTASLCTLKMLKPGVPTVNIFKIKRHKGWWPFKGKCHDNNEEVLTGKVEIEIQLLTEEEAKLSPAGLGREDPQGLPMPQRPDISFAWFRNPLKALKYLICKRFGAQIIIFFVTSILIFMTFVAIYAFPNYTVKRLLGAK